MNMHAPLQRRFTRNLLSIAIASVLIAGCGGDDDDNPGTPASGNPLPTTITKSTVLSGNQEFEPVITAATGSASFVVDSVSKALTGEVSLIGINASEAHIHTGAPGVNGAPFVTLTVDNVSHKATVPANTTLTQAQYDDLLAGNLYVNVHSAAQPDGEIRGQIGRIVVTANLSGAQEVPPTITPATGTARFSVDPSTLTVSGRVNFIGVAATAAHLHPGAAGVNGAPAVTLTVSADSATVPDGTKLASAQQLDELVAGKFYVNVHSAAVASGEIRGQLGPAAAVATLNGAQEAPAPVVTGATGKGAVVIDPVSRAISGGIVFSGVTATAAHIHTGAAGTAGPVLIGLVLGTDGTSASIPPETVLTQAQFDDLVAGNLYFNVHSAANPGGEIRGQIDLQ